MFDYHYGTSTKKFKQDLDGMKPNFAVSPSPISQIYSSILTFCHGLDVISILLCNKAWYTASWSRSVWQTLSESFCLPERVDILLELSESKLRIYERRCLKSDQPVPFASPEIRLTLKWKLVYGQLLYNTCSSCGIPENKLRFLPILQKSLCFSCAKSPEFSMISLENAEYEHHVSRESINLHQIEGLRVPDPADQSKFILVYYTSDIIKLKKLIESEKKESSLATDLEERRRTELIYYMKQQGFHEGFISYCLETVGNLACNYISGKSRLSAEKVVQKLVARYNKWKDTEEEEILPEPELILPLKRPRLVLNAEEKTKRRFELVERLLVMGVNSDDIGLEDPESLANAFIEGRTKEDLGPVAGAIWRDHKPVFAGVPFRKNYVPPAKPEEALSDSD